MLLNQNLVQRKVLKQALIGEIIRINNLLKTQKFIISEAKRLFHNINEDAYTLQNLKLKFSFHIEQIDRKKLNLSQSLNSKKQHRDSIQSILHKQMKLLKQQCNNIRQIKKKVNELIKKQNKLQNQLQELQIIEEMKDHQKKMFQRQSLEDIFLSNSLKKSKKQLKMILQARKSSMNLQKKMKQVERKDLQEYESKISVLRQQLNEKQLQNKQLDGQYQKKNNEILKLSENLIQRKETLQMKNKQLIKICLESQHLSMKFQKNKQREVQIQKQIIDRINKSNQLNEKLQRIKSGRVMVREEMTRHRILNVQVKGKIRELMRLVVEGE